MSHSHTHDQPPANPWGVDSTAYSIEKFYTRSTDRNGHRSHLRVNVPPEVLGRLEGLVAKRAIPEYRTAADLVRDAIHHRLHWLEGVLDDPDLSQSLSIDRHQSEVDQLKLEVQENINLIESTKEVFAICASVEDWWGLAVALETATDKADELRHPFSGRLAGLIRENRKMYAKQLDEIGGQL